MRYFIFALIWILGSTLNKKIYERTRIGDSLRIVIVVSVMAVLVFLTMLLFKR